MRYITPRRFCPSFVRVDISIRGKRTDKESGPDWAWDLDWARYRLQCRRANMGEALIRK